MPVQRPNLGFWHIVNMNVGFFGIQFSFGLQQSSMSPIYQYLGADAASLPYLWLAGPVTGLVVQPLIGALSDKTTSRLGRRTPYFLLGALLCSLGLLAMPFSPSLWMAASLLWILDAANNITMEPYRAYVSDQLNAEQANTGFLIQSAFTGMAQTLAYLTPFILVSLGMHPDWVNPHHIPYMTVCAFVIGAFFSIASVLWSVRTCPERPLDAATVALIRQQPAGWKALLADIQVAFIHMPQALRQMLPMMLLQWYAMFCYWQYITLSLAQTFFADHADQAEAMRQASLINAKIGGFYNFAAMIFAFLMIPVVKKAGPRNTHALSLLLAGMGMLALPHIHDQIWLLLPMLGIGLAWASMMGNPYSMLANAVPRHQVGIYMGIFNMFIVIPMFIQILTLPLYYASWLQSSPVNVIYLAGALLVLAACATLLVSKPQHSRK